MHVNPGAQGGAYAFATVAPMSSRSKDTHTPNRVVRIDDDLWDRLEAAAIQANPDFTRSQIIRWMIRWYVGDADDLPPRPARPGDGR
jgi:hypothetical protein